MKKVALVTGGAARIGASIALNLSKIDYDIALHFNSSNKEALNLKKKFMIMALNVNCLNMIFQK